MRSIKTTHFHTPPGPAGRGANWSRAVAVLLALGASGLFGLTQPDREPRDAPAASPAVSPATLAAQLGAEALPAVGGIDGDTIEVLLNGRRVPVDLRGLRAASEEPRGVTPAFAPEAAFFVHNFVAGERLRLAGIVVTAQGRASAYVQRLPDGMDLNAELVRQGFARADADDRHPRSNELLELQDRAALLQKGLWGDRRVVRDGASPSAADPAPATPAPRTEGRGGAGGGAPGGGAGQVGLDAARTVYITPSGSKYHRFECRYARTASSREVGFDEVGPRTPCSICQPPAIETTRGG